MDVMTDKEVGELWRTVIYWAQQPYPPSNTRLIEGLIRKLVEERMQLLEERCQFGAACIGPHGHELEALNDFGIPQESWNDGR